MKSMIVMLTLFTLVGCAGKPCEVTQTPHSVTYSCPDGLR